MPRTTRPRLSLAQLFAVTLIGLVLLLGVLFWLLLAGSRRAILETSTQMRETVSREIADKVSDYLGQADAAVRELSAQVERGVLDPHDLHAVEAALYAQLLAHENLDQITLTFAKGREF